MAAFTPKAYQQSVLDSIEAYFRACHELPTPSTAFTVVTEQLWQQGMPYNSLPELPSDMPYFCLRVPTGGGKTWLAAKSVSLVNTHLLRSEYSVILWLVPSTAILTQTVAGLRGRNHPYHAALREAGPVTVLGLDEAKSVTRATLETSTTIIVSTRQAFQVDDIEVRKVYESSGTLMHHFDNITQEQKAHLDVADDGTYPYSLANVLRLRRPFIIVDEAHNSRTDLSFEMLGRFRPSGIMELTATPDTKKTPSNVLHSVSAAELKAEEMIKLPIMLETEPDWQQCLADAIGRRGELQSLANQDERTGAPYLRPIVLIQAQPHRKKLDTLHVERVRTELIENHNIPEEEIIIATGEQKGLEKIEADYEKGIASEKCPVKYVLTQRALAEGWDCPFAYILVSMAELHSATAIEQLLGRVLRQPGARRRDNDALNQSYAFVVSRNFSETAGSLRDRLVEGAGFERRDAIDFVRAVMPKQEIFDLDGHRGQITIKPVVVPMQKKPDLRKVPKPVRKKLTWDNKKKTLTINEPLTETDTESLKAVMPDESAKQTIVKAAEVSRTDAIEFFHTPAELGEEFKVPQIALQIQGEMVLFDDPEVLDYPWELSGLDANPTSDEVSKLEFAQKASGGGAIDVDESGKVTTEFIANLQRDLGFAYQPENWDEVKLAAWLCQNLPEPSITHASKQAFVSKWMSELHAQSGFNMGRINRQKFLIRNLLEKRIRDLRCEAVKQAYQQTLFEAGNEERVSVGGTYTLTFESYTYAPNKDYDGRWEHYAFRNHYYGRIGDLDSKEEFECAAWLDQQAERGRIQFWIRNLVRKEGAFYFQKADGRFYPDFICKLPDGVILVVEYKGANLWAGHKDDRLIGGLWEELSGGRCRFVMVKNKEWNWIENKLTSKQP